ncbi:MULTISPECIES: hypothetical protein [Streptomyces]|uniref:Uncharacterized protein n=1 Tax=Streptomyces nondiastaticus TaxID=3154512 RepID=A0ABW6U2Q7_9ACTN|nr:hypothetical protein [Streptomyces sp. VNUA116]WKU43203.1 hypothetical protein Q3V23_03430 [Streptomyces sp. VNUA116]
MEELVLQLQELPETDDQRLEPAMHCQVSLTTSRCDSDCCTDTPRCRE